MARPPTSRPPIALGWPVSEKGPQPGLADPSRRQMAIDDRIDLVGAGRGLIDALRIGRDGLFRRREPFIEAREIARIEAAVVGDRRQIPRFGLGGGKRFGKAGCTVVYIISVDRLVLGEIGEQAIEQKNIGAGARGKMQIGGGGGRGAARIDHDDARAAPFARGFEPLKQDRMAPGGIGADEHDEIRQFQIVIGAGHEIFAEGAAMPGDAGCHAEPRIRVDIGGAEKAFGELVDDVIILGQQLAGDIEGDRLRPVLGDRRLKAMCDEIERLVPFRIAAGNFWTQQATGQAERFAERRAFGAEPAGIGGMIRIARDVSIPVDDHAAADATIGAGGARHLVHAAASWPALARLRGENIKASRAAGTAQRLCIRSR